MATIAAKPFTYEFDIDPVARLCIDMERDFVLELLGPGSAERMSVEPFQVSQTIAPVGGGR